MKNSNCRNISIIFLIAVLVFAALPASAQMPPSSLVEIPDTDAEFASRLSGLASKPGNASDFFRLKLAETKIKSGDEKAAVKIAERADNRALAFWKNVVMAEASLTEGEPQRAIALLNSLPPRPAPELSFGEEFYANLYKRALLTLRAAKLALGKSAANEEAELAANFPMASSALSNKSFYTSLPSSRDPQRTPEHASGHARRAPCLKEFLGQCHQELNGQDAGYSQDLSVEQRVVKLHALAFAYKSSLLGGVITPTEITGSRLSREQKCKALYDLGYGLRRSSGMEPIAAEAFEGIIDQKCDRNLEARALYWIGTLGSAAGKDEEAKRSLARLAGEFKGHRLQDDAFYMLYKRAERDGDAALAKKYFDELMGLQKGDMRDKLVFEMAFPRYTQKDYAGAAAIIEPIVESGAADETFTQDLYWYARSLQNMGGKKNNEKAAEIYSRIVSQYPYSFYAVMASDRANVPLNIPPLPKLDGKAPSGGDDYFAFIDALNGGGFHNAAKMVMDLAMNLNPSWEKSNEEFVARKYIESQNYRKALDMAAAHFDSAAYGPVETQTDPMAAAFFPLAFPDAVAGGYRLTNLPRGAIEGIMREESLFQRNVRSHAGAVGLMQLMPRTAAMVARGGAGGASASDLTDPVDNVLLGSSYLSQMLDIFGQMPYAIMAYNAGPGNVNKFQRSLKGLDLDLFIENIPLAETRGYVKRVMRSQRVYASLYKGEKGKKAGKAKRRGKR